MKYLLISFLILSSGCQTAGFYNLLGIRKFAVGDCVILSLNEPESWEKLEPELIVVELGKDSYKTVRYEYPNSVVKLEYGHYFEDFYQKVPCQ